MYPDRYPSPCYSSGASSGVSTPAMTPPLSNLYASIMNQQPGWMNKMHQPQHPQNVINRIIQLQDETNRLIQSLAPQMPYQGHHGYEGGHYYPAMLHPGMAHQYYPPQHPVADPHYYPMAQPQCHPSELPATPPLRAARAAAQSVLSGMPNHEMLMQAVMAAATELAQNMAPPLGTPVALRSQTPAWLSAAAAADTSAVILAPYRSQPSSPTPTESPIDDANNASHNSLAEVVAELAKQTPYFGGSSRAKQRSDSGCQTAWSANDDN